MEHASDSATLLAQSQPLKRWPIERERRHDMALDIRATGRIRGLGRFALAGLMVGTLGLSQVRGAAAASGVVGLHWAPEASCDLRLNPTVTAHAPHIESSTVTYPANIFIVGSNHTQWVGFRTWLLRWNPSNRTWAYTDQNRDGQLDHGPILQAQVSNGSSYLDPTNWYNVDLKQWQYTGMTSLPIRDAGYYRVRTEYFWYADSQSGGGSDVLDSVNHFVLTGQLVTAQAWCQY
jgi:hypothetical protein